MSTTHTSTARSLAGFIDAAARFEAMEGFPSVDELLADADRLAAGEPRITPHRIGTSRLGEAIHEYRVGDGPRHAIVVGGVHPNEPIGFHTVRLLLMALSEDPALGGDRTWHIIPCIDPDGARLNEGWFGDPSRRTHYARHFYRPAPNEQVEWSFPLSYKRAYFDRVMPETLALMRLIDETAPDLLIGLHNSELGGAYYYLNRQVPGAVDALHAIPDAFGVPLEAGEPESVDLEAFGPAVYRAPLSAEHYEYIERSGGDPTTEIGGGSTADYVARHGTVTFIAELPYWTHPEAVDTSMSGRSYSDVLAQKGDGLQRLGDELGRVLTNALPHLTSETPFLRASRAFVPLMSSAGDAEARRATSLDVAREATVAEAFTNADLVRCFRLRYGGMLLRALHAEVCAGTAHVALRRLHAEFSQTYEEWLGEAESVEGLTSLPIESLVGVQFASTLSVAALIDAGAS